MLRASLSATRRAALWCALSAVLTTGVAAQPVLRINGTGSGTGGMHLLADAYMKKYPEVRVEVQPASGSAGGLRALIARQLELAVSNRKPNAEELGKTPLVSVEYARTPFVVALHQDMGITSLTSAQLAAVYAEGLATFPNGKRARPVLRLSDATDTKLLKSFSPEVAAAVDAASIRRGMLSADTDGETADMIEQIAGAISVSTLALISSEKRRMQALTIDAKVPSVSNLSNGSYPYFKSLFLTVRPDAGPNTKLFAAFVQSAEGRLLLRAHGHAPT